MKWTLGKQTFNPPPLLLFGVFSSKKKYFLRGASLLGTTSLYWFALFEVWMKPFSVALAKLDTVPFWCINWPHNGEGTINVNYFQTSKQTWTFGDFKKTSHQGNFLSRFSRESSLKFQLNEKLLRKAFCSCSSKTKIDLKTKVDLHSRNDYINAIKKQSNGE